MNYAELIDRIKASFVDMLVFVALMFLAANIFSGMNDVSGTVRVGTLIGIFCVYEPLFVSLFGGTIGHISNGLRVRRESDLKRNISFPIAVVRYGVKVFLGIISLFTVSSNDKNKAIHDNLVSSVVIRVK